MNKKVTTKQTIPYLTLIAIIAVILIMFSFGNNTVNELSYDELITEFSKGNVTEISTSERSAAGYYQITGKLKTSQVATARHVAIYLIRTMLDVSFVRIGELFSNRDHATIMYSVNKIEKMLKTDDKMLTVINKLKKQLS